MAFITDTFTEGGFTDLENHTADSGATYTKHSASAAGGGLEVDANNDALRVDNSDNAYSLYYASEAPAGAEYDLEITIERLSNDTGGVRNLGICGRVDTTSEDYYAVVWDNTNDEWELWKVVGGTRTVLGTFAETFTVGTTRTVRLEIRDAAKKVFIDGTERISSTDNAITAAGRAGFTGQASNTKLLADDFTATDVASGITVSLGTVSFNLDLGEALGVLRELVPVTFDLAPQALTVKQEAVVPLGTVTFPFSPQTLSPGVGAGQTIPLGVVAFNFSPQDIAWQRLRDLGVVQFPFSARPLSVSGGESVGGTGSTTGITHITDVGTI